MLNINIWGIWVKGILESFVLFLQTFYKSELISKLKFKRLFKRANTYTYTPLEAPDNFWICKNVIFQMEETK